MASSLVRASSLPINEIAGLALDQRDDAGLGAVASHHGVDLPMTDLRACLDRCRPLTDHAFARQSTTRITTAIELAPLLLPETQMLEQQTAAPAIALHVSIDRLVTDRQCSLCTQMSGDLFWTPVLVQELEHLTPIVRSELALLA